MNVKEGSESYNFFLLPLNLSRLRVASLFAIILVPASSAIDLLTNPQYVIPFLKIRLLCSFVSTIIFSLSFRVTFQKYSVYLGILLTWCVGFSIARMIYILGFETPYYAGLNLIILTVGVLFPWGFKETLVSCLGIYAFYLVPSLFSFDQIQDRGVYFSNNIFIVETIIIAIASNYFSSRLRYQEFKARFDLNEAYKKLQEVDKAKMEFFANISHELRTPLTLILAPMESIIKGKVNLPETVQKGSLEIMYRNALRLLKLINNLLDLAKIDAGKMGLYLAETDVSQFLKGIIASVEPMAQKKNIQLLCEIQNVIPNAFLDRDKLEKVILNLLFNSLKFTDADGKVSVICRYANQQLEFVVEDNGIGIPSEYLPKIFSRFSQADTSATRKYEGTGIGMAMAKEFVELHQGKIWVESELGKGTRIFFNLPHLTQVPTEESKVEAVLDKRVRPGDVEQKKRDMDWTRELHQLALYQGEEKLSQAPADYSPVAKGRAVTLLLVEDNPDMLSFIGFQLQDDYNLIKVSNGVEGVEAAQKSKPDLIISDVMMPLKDGYQLCRELKEDPKTQHIPIILLTAKADLSMKIEGLQQGADEYLTKPFSAEELRARIKSLLNSRHLEKQIQNRNEALEKAMNELKEAEMQLVQSEKMASVGQLAAGIAHEMNNPLTFVSSSLFTLNRFLQKVKDGKMQEKQFFEDITPVIERVTFGIKRTKAIIDDLMRFARKDMESLREEDINEGIHSVITLLENRFSDKVRLHKELNDIPNVECVMGQINQVIMNLMINALDAVPEEGDIWICTSKNGNGVEIKIKDTGRGIPKEIQKRIFEPFFTTKDVGMGTGLGLSISHKIIENHHGVIHFESDPGKGTEFIIKLPVRQSVVQEVGR